MINQKKRLLNTLNHKLLFGVFVFCLAVVAGTTGCSDSGGKSKTGYYLSGYDGVVSEQVVAQQSLVSAIGNVGLEFYAEFPWFVNMTYQVFDKDQWGVGDLTVEDFSVLEDGIDVSQLVSEMNIRQRDALPSEYSYTIKTVMFLDNTPSLSVGLEKMLESGQVIVDNIDELQQQEIAIVAYDETGEAELVQDFTDSVTDLTNALSPVDGIQPSYGTTNFYNGVISALTLWEDNHSSAIPAFQQGFLVAVTDGKDTTSLSNVNDAIIARGDKQVIVVAVGNDIPDSILNDLERLGNGGFYHVTDPLKAPDAGADKNENLCETMLIAQNRMLAYADGFYWLQYKTLLTSESSKPMHTAVLSILDNGNLDKDSQISGTFSSDVLFSGDTSIYFDTSASDPDGIIQKTFTIERGQGAGEVGDTIQALTYSESGASPSQYEWSSGDTSIVTVEADSMDSSKGYVNVIGSGDTFLTVTDLVNNVTQTLLIIVKVRTESFEMIKHVVTSKEPWFADATFQVRNTDSENNQWNWITDLAREDMTVLENEIEIDMENSETHLRKRDNIPSTYSYALKTVLLIDNSPSTREGDNLLLMKEAAVAFVNRALINNPNDRTDYGPLLDPNDETSQQEIAIVSYDEDGDTILVLDFSTDLDTLTDAIEGIVAGFAPIDFYGGVLDALNLWDNDQLPYDANNDFVQGVVVVMSDGWQSNPGFYDLQAVLDETGSKQILCVGVGDDLVSENSEDLIAIGNAGFYSVPDPGQTTKVVVYPDNGGESRKVTYTVLELTLIDIQDDAVVPYANSFYWLDYKSDLEPAPVCDRSETMLITINNNSNISAGRYVAGKFESCNFFEGIDGMIYVNSTVTNPDGITGGIDLYYVMMGDIPLAESIYPMEAFTYNHENTPAYEWLISNPNIVNVTVDPRSYANSRATLSLPTPKQDGSAFLNVTDSGNGGVFRRFTVNVDGIRLPAPIAYYPFDGNADDESGNGYDGEVFGATLTTDRDNRENSAYAFDGSNYIALDMFYGPNAGAVSDIIDQLTVSVWVKIFVSNDVTIAEKIIDFDPLGWWSLAIWNGRAAFSSDSAEPFNLVSGDSYLDNKWHHICATYDSVDTNNTKLYVDGILVGEETIENGPIVTGVARYGFIGTAGRADEYNGAQYGNANRHKFNGVIDDVIVFDQVLSEQAIQELAN